LLLEIVSIEVDVEVVGVGVDGFEIDVGVDVGVTGLVCMKNKKPITAITTTIIPTTAINKEFLCMKMHINV
jgi:hypothetical protein